MKLAQTTLTMILLAAGLCVQAAQESPSTNATAVVVQAATNQPAADTVEPGPAAPATPAENGDTNGLRMNFRGAPLNLVLDYLSDAAGFIINKEADVKGTVEVWSKDPLTKEAARALVARAATRIDPDPSLGADVPELISAMLAAGYDRAAARWIGAIRRMEGEPGDRAWAMLVLSSSDPRGLDISFSRINGFISRDKSPGKVRSSLLVAALAGLGRISIDAANRFR